MKKIFVKQSIFVKLCGVFVLVICLLSLIGYSIYNWGINIILKQMANEACMQNKIFSDNLSRELKRITMLQYDLVDDWDLMKLNKLSFQYTDYEKSMMILRIRDKINAIKTSSNLIEEIRVIIPSAKKSIDTMAARDMDVTDRYLIDSYAEMPNKQIIHYSGQLMLISEYPEVYYKRDFSPEFLIHTILSQTAIKDFMEDMSIHRESKGFIFSESRDVLISDENYQEIAGEIKETILSKKGLKIAAGNISMINTHVLQQKINGVKYIIVYTDMDFADIKLVRYVPESAYFGALNQYHTIMWIFAVAAILISVIFSKLLYSMIHTPLKKLIKAFAKVQNADFSIAITHHSQDEFRYIYDGFNTMVSELNRLIEEVYRERLLLEKANLKQLQAQINPHFLYNSFLILNNRIQMGDNEFATEFCRELGYYFMFITRNKKEVVPLKDEVRHAVAYAKIQHIRFQNRLEMEIDPLPKQYESILVPKIILQPILENAFEHTLENMEKGGYLHMGYVVQDKYLDIVIEDNGTDLDDQQLCQLQNNLERTDIEVTGMINIHQRLKLVYSEGNGLILNRSQLGGLQVIVRIFTRDCEVDTDV